ncbi:MAG: sigma-70 family RNA polymerase sigma factor [bacterium]|nr:sigma-70 family RNA polymerase sigma factor [bacterium]
MNEHTLTPEMRIWIDQSQGLVRSIASKIATNLPAHVNYEDLVSYGQLGLMQAAYAFQPDKDVAFQTFAYHRIRGAIYDGLGKMAWTNRSMRQRIRAERLSAELMEQQVRATQEEWKSMAADAEQVVRTTERITLVHLLSEASGEGQGIERSVAATEVSPDECLAYQETCEILRCSVGTLPEDQKRIIEQVYYEGLTLTQVAQSLGRSKSWASRLHARALESLARSLNTRGA